MQKKYIWILVRHSINIFSGLSFLIGLLAAFILQLGNLANALIITAAAFTSIVIAGYFAWKEAIEQLERAANFSLVYNSVVFTPSIGSRGGIPVSPMCFKINLDAANRGVEPIVLRTLKVTQFEINNELFGALPIKTELILNNASHGMLHINLPYTIEAGERLPDLEFNVFVEINFSEPEDFARRMVELEDYKIELSYTFDDMERTDHTHFIEICGSFADYVEERISAWSEDPHQQNLALVALKAKGVIGNSKLESS